VSSVGSERNVFSLNTAIMAVAEGNFGRLGGRQQQYYTTGNARIQLDRSVWEMPGAMPEIVPGGDFGANIDRLFTERSMADAGLRRVRSAVAGDPPVAWRLTGSRPRPSRRGAAAADRATQSVGEQRQTPCPHIDVAAEHQGSTRRLQRPGGALSRQATTN
jgi:hypothetical protein